MTALDEFRHLSTLLGVVERLGSPKRVQTLTFRDTTGKVVGHLTLESGMIRFGVSVEGQSGVDEEFLREATPYSALLQRLIERKPLEAAESQRLEGVPLLLRRIFRSLTARILRRLSTHCDLRRIEVQVEGEDESPPSPLARVMNHAFPPVELLLTAGRSGTVRYADAAARIYETPPTMAEQRWLFEWQADDQSCPWPVMTNRQAELKVATVSQIGMLGQELARYLTVTQKTETPLRVRSQIVCSDSYVYFLVSTQQYFALFVYQSDQLDRVVKSLEGLVGSDCAADGALPPSNMSAGSTQVISATKATAVTSVPKVRTRWPAKVVTVPGIGVPRLLGPAAPTVAPAVRNANRVAMPVVTGTQDAPAKASPAGAAAAGGRDVKAGAAAAAPVSAVALASAGAASATAAARTDVAPARLPPASVSVPPLRPQSPPPTIAVVAAVSPALGETKEQPPFALARLSASSRSSPTTEAEEWLMAAGLVDTAALADSSQASAGLAATLPPVAAAPSAPTPTPASSLAVELAVAPGSPLSVLAPSGTIMTLPLAPSLPSPPEPALLAARPEPELQSPVVPAPIALPPEPDPMQSPATPASVACRPEPEPNRTPAPEQPRPPERVAAAVPVRASAAQTTAVASSADQAPSFENPLLTVRKFSARLEGRTILKDIGFALGRHGVYAMMGPGGSGKSSMLGILSGRNRAGTGWMLSGEITYQGSLLGSAARPAVVGQKISRPAVSLRSYLLEYVDYPDSKRDGERIVELLSHCQLDRLARSLDAVLGTPPLGLSAGEWWRLAIARELLADPPLLCVDEPTAGLADAEAQPMVSLLRAEGQRRTVLLVSHNQQHVRECSDYVILLAAGQLQEYRSTQDFFEQPRSKAARDYVRTGGCYAPSPDTKAEDLDLSQLADAEPDTAQATAESLYLSESANAPSSHELPTAPAVAPQTSRPDVEPPSAPKSESRKLLTHAESAGYAGSLATEVLWQDTAPVLRLRGFGVTFGSRSVIAGLDLDIGASGIHLLVISDGMEKRLLLRALCGPQSKQLRCTGQAAYQGNMPSDGNAPVLVAPDVRMMSRTAGEYLMANFPARARSSREEQREQAVQLVQRAGFPSLVSRLDQLVSNLELPERRVLDVLSAVSTDPALLCLDEPLSQMSVDGQERLLALLLLVAKQRALLIMAQDAGPFLRDGGKSRLVVGYCTEGVLSAAPPPALSGPEPDAPRSPEIAQRGSSRERYGEASATPPWAPDVAAAAEPGRQGGESKSSFARPTGCGGPRGFQWLREGSLAGMPAPGMTADLEYDLDLIRGTGVTCLVTLTMTPLPAEVLRQHGLQSLFFPIEDMGAPTLEAAAKVCDQITELLAQGQVVGFHCKAGYGRTGTMLASQLIWEGADAKTALAQVRAIDPNWVQSDSQENFLGRLAVWRQDNRTPRNLATSRLDDRAEKSEPRWDARTNSNLKEE